MTKQLTLAMLIIALTLTSILTTGLSAQVTIGSGQPPNKGTLLDLKQEADGTSKKGMVLSRVKLTDINALTRAIQQIPLKAHFA